MRSFCRKNPVHKIPRFRGGFFGGGECRFYFYGREDFSEMNSETIMDVNNYIPFSTINSQAIDVM